VAGRSAPQSTRIPTSAVTQAVECLVATVLLGDVALFLRDTTLVGVGEPQLDELFGTEPAKFIAIRDKLAKQAKDAGQADLAKEIAALRKPTVVTWLINQLADHDPDVVAALLKAGKRLNDAHRAVLRGSGGHVLREASESWRAAVTHALVRIRELSNRPIDEPRIAATLRGAVSDPEDAKLLQRGRLTQELKPPGIETVLSAVGEARPQGSTGHARRAAEASTNRKTVSLERQRKREAAKKTRALERAAAKARQEAERATEVAARLERRAKATADEASAAREKAVAAARRADDLAAQVERLRRSPE